MSQSVLAGFDIGTSKIRCILYNIHGKILISYDHKTPIIRKKDGFYNPTEQLYLISLKILKKIFNFSNKKNLIVRGIAFSSVGEAGVPIDINRKALMDIIPWYDQRTEINRNKFLKKINSNMIFKHTGLNNDHFYSAFKLLWIKKNKKKIYSKIYKWLPVNDYIAMRLTENISTDYSQAMRTLLFDPKKMNWSSKMISLLELKKSILPEILNAGEKKGVFTKKIKKYLSINYDCIVGVGGHDHFVGIFGLGGFNKSTAVNSLGSAEAISINTEKYHADYVLHKSKFISGVFKTKYKSNYYVVGSILTSGLIIEWFMKNFKIKTYKELNFILKNAKGVEKDIFVFPQFEYSHSPINSFKTKGLISGLNRSTSDGDIYKSILECLSFDTKNAMDFIIKYTNTKVKKFICSGGSAKNKEWIKIKSNIIDKKIFVDRNSENVSLGSAILAGLACNIYLNEKDAFNKINNKFFIINKNSKKVSSYKRSYKKYVSSIKKITELNNFA